MACTGIDTAADAGVPSNSPPPPRSATALAHPCPVARNSVGYATALRIHDMAPMGAAGTRPTSIMSTSPHRRDESVRDSGTKSSGMDTAAHALATHRGFTFDRNADERRDVPHHVAAVHDENGDVVEDDAIDVLGDPILEELPATKHDGRVEHQPVKVERLHKRQRPQTNGSEQVQRRARQAVRRARRALRVRGGRGAVLRVRQQQTLRRAPEPRGTRPPRRAPTRSPRPVPCSPADACARVTPSFFFSSRSDTISTPRGSACPVFSAHTRSSARFASADRPRSANHEGDSSNQHVIASASVRGSAVTNASRRHPPESSIAAPMTVTNTTPTLKERLASCVSVSRTRSGHASASRSTGTNARRRRGRRRNDTP